MCGRHYVPDEDSAAELREIFEQINRREMPGPSSRPARSRGLTWRRFY